MFFHLSTRFDPTKFLRTQDEKYHLTQMRPFKMIRIIVILLEIVTFICSISLVCNFPVETKSELFNFFGRASRKLNSHERRLNIFN